MCVVGLALLSVYVSKRHFLSYYISNKNSFVYLLYYIYEYKMILDALCAGHVQNSTCYSVYDWHYFTSFISQLGWSTNH